MKFCQACGQSLEPRVRFCPQCGNSQIAPASSGAWNTNSGNVVERAFDFAENVENLGRRLWPLWVGLSLLATGLFIAGIFYFLGKSEPALLSQKILRESPVVRQAIGEIQDIGWANGGISTRSGGMGTANFTMSVKGSLAKGKFYAYFEKRHDLWRYASGRLRLSDGRSVDIPPL